MNIYTIRNMFMFNDEKYNIDERKNNILIPNKQTVLNLIENQNHSIMFRNDDNTIYGLLNSLSINKIYDNILGEDIKYGPVKTQYTTSSFDTIINNTELKITHPDNNKYICYESKNKICIVEAKMKPYEDFNIRQLYYPFREVYDVVGTNKEIFCLYVFKDRSNIIHIYKFEWHNYKNMLDVENTGYYTYKIINKKKKKN